MYTGNNASFSVKHCNYVHVLVYIKSALNLTISIVPNKKIVYVKMTYMYCYFLAEKSWQSVCAVFVQTLAPVYQQLARKYKARTNLVISKFDASANDAPPQFQFDGNKTSPL